MYIIFNYYIYILSQIITINIVYTLFVNFLSCFIMNCDLCVFKFVKSNAIQPLAAMFDYI